MEKLFVMQVAAQLTQAACGSSGSLPVDPELKDNTVRARNLQVWETFRVFYRGVLGALSDTQSWPAPKLDLSQTLPSLLQGLAPLVASGPFAEIVQKLLAALPSPVRPPAGPIPDPGAATVAGS